MDQSTFDELRNAGVSLSTALLRIGSGIDATVSEEFSRKLRKAERLVMAVTKEALKQDPCLWKR